MFNILQRIKDLEDEKEQTRADLFEKIRELESKLTIKMVDQKDYLEEKIKEGWNK